MMKAQTASERAALTAKLADLLKAQREKFIEYIDVLKRQERSIQEEDTDALFFHTELEKQIVASLTTLQNAIVPMQRLYDESAVQAHDAPATISSLQKEISVLQNNALIQNEKNRRLLQTHIALVKSQLDTFKNPYKTSRSIYAEKSSSGAIISYDA